jgi:hypothetical protein
MPVVAAGDRVQQVVLVGRQLAAQEQAVRLMALMHQLQIPAEVAAGPGEPGQEAEQMVVRAVPVSSLFNTPLPHQPKQPALFRSQAVPYGYALLV